MNIWSRFKGKPFSGLVSYSSLEITVDRLTDLLKAARLAQEKKKKKNQSNE